MEIAEQIDDFFKRTGQTVFIEQKPRKAEYKIL